VRSSNRYIISLIDFRTPVGNANVGRGGRNLCQNQRRTVLGICRNRNRTKLLFDVNVFDRYGTDSVTSFLTELAEKHSPSGAMFLVDGYGYRTVLFQIGLSGQLSYTDRNLIESKFHMLKHRIDLSIHQRWAVGPAFNPVLIGLCITIVISDRINRLTIELLSKKS
jgi:DDE domain